MYLSGSDLVSGLYIREFAVQLGAKARYARDA
jgi:hypothetical protein